MDARLGSKELPLLMVPSVIILTYNSAASLPATLSSLAGLTDDLHVIDSGSTDDTLAIAASFGAAIKTHAFENYGAQRNWAMDNIDCLHGWQLHLDADERLSSGLSEEIRSIPEACSYNGFFVPRYVGFLGRVLRHNLAPTWHMRLFRHKLGRCEDREYDQHFLCSGATARLRNEMIDDVRMSLTEWTARHNRWSDAEVREISSASAQGRVRARVLGNPIERKRSMRSLYDRCPWFLRALMLFSVRYFGGGFLDGKEGLIFCVLQTFWFRFLIDAKLYEQQIMKKGQSAHLA